MLRFAPYYQAAPWGGRRLAEELGRTLPEGPIGEAWELCDLDERQSLVAQGPLAGSSLGELWRAGGLGGTARGEFPFLLKWLDTREWLSVQVHPSGEACARLGHGKPKTEAWYVARAEPGAVLLAGHYPGLDPATLKQAAQGGTLRKWLHEVAPRAGDMLLIAAGTLHAVGPGFLLLEVQEPSDTTFRVYDWGRLGLDGQPRALHLEAAAASVAYQRPGPPKVSRREVVGPRFAMRLMQAGAQAPAGALRVWVADGDALLASERGETALRAGDVVVAEADDGLIGVQGGACLLLGEALR